jgi:hypothetical protein
LLIKVGPPSILGLERERLQLVSYVTLEPEDAVDPIQDDAERLGLTHVLLAFDESGKKPLDHPQCSSLIDSPCELGQSVLKHDIHVFNWINLVIIALCQ